MLVIACEGILLWLILLDLFLLSFFHRRIQGSLERSFFQAHCQVGPPVLLHIEYLLQLVLEGGGVLL